MLQQIIYTSFNDKLVMAASRLERRIEDIILFYLISTKLLQFFGLAWIFEFIGIYPGEIHFIDIIVSMTALGYVLYKASLSDIFFGKRNIRLDIILILSYFTLIINKLVEYSAILVTETRLLQDFLLAIIENDILIKTAAFYTGTLILLLISAYATLRIKVNEPSILNALHADKENISRFAKFISVFLVVVGFYLMFFNLIMEWLTIALDAPLILIAIFLYAFKIHNLGKKMDSEMVLFKVAEFVDEFLEKFITLFHSKKTLFLGISGMLVLHLISDLGIFIIPYILGTPTPYHFDIAHQNIAQLFTQDKSMVIEPSMQILLLLAYMANTLGIIFLMLFPAFIWYVLYRNTAIENTDNIEFPGSLISLFFGLLVFIMFLPVYKVTGIPADPLVSIIGVEIQTQSVLVSGNSVPAYLSIALSVFIIIYALTRLKFLKEIFFLAMTLISVGFFGIYIYSFFNSMFWYHVETLKFLLYQQSYYIAFYNLVFLLIFILFYIGGYISFVISLFRTE
jgi:hypothetical protein